MLSSAGMNWFSIVSFLFKGPLYAKCVPWNSSTNSPPRKGKWTSIFIFCATTYSALLTQTAGSRHTRSKAIDGSSLTRL
jgi:hypothetical protein